MADWNYRKKISDYKNYIVRPLQNPFFTKTLLLIINKLHLLFRCFD